MQSRAATVEQYLAELPADRRSAIESLRQVFKQNIDPRYAEVMAYGMLGYVVPHSIYPAGYHCDPKQPLPFSGMASQKGHMSLYLACVGAPDAEQAWFRKAWLATGRKLDMGKACIRFKKIEDVPLDVVGEYLRRNPVEVYIKQYEALLAGPRPASSAKPAATPKAGAKAKPASKSKSAAARPVAASTRRSTAKGASGRSKTAAAKRPAKPARAAARRA